MRYNPSVHAVERIRERFGIMEEHAKNFANQLMQSAKYVTTQPDGKVVYKHDGKDAMLVVDTNANVIVTILPPANAGKRNRYTKSIDTTNAIIEKAHAVIKRELAKARRSYNAEYRALSLEQAEVSLEIAQANVKKVRCKAPHTKVLIQERIDALQAYHQTIEAKLVAIKDEQERMTAEAMALVGSEVNV